MEFIKYPPTAHLWGSKGLEEGVPVWSLLDGELVAEEKIDGTQAGLSFDDSAEPVIQSRGSIVTDDREFALMRTWASAHDAAFYDRLTTRYVMFGEWAFYKHTVFYDRLPHYFLEFDVYDREAECFLSTDARRELLKGLPVASVPVLYRGRIGSADELDGLIVRSRFKSPDWREELRKCATTGGLDPTTVASQTDRTDASEGLYVKHEQDGRVIGRYKFIRRNFLETIEESGSHWASRPRVQNLLAPGVDIFKGV